MYRVWCKNNNKWEKDVLLSPRDTMYEMTDRGPRVLNPFTHILQFNSHVKDSKGKYIFDGDLLYSPELSRPIEVWYDNNGSWLAGIKEGDNRCDDYLWRTLGQFKDCIIIGNIFEGVIGNDL